VNNRPNKTEVIQITIFFLFSLFFIIKNISRSWNGIRIDFPSFYYATILAYKGISPYIKNIWDEIGLLNFPNQDLYPFLHIPFSLVLFYPLILVDYQVSQSILFIVNIAATFLLIYLIFIRILGKSFLDPIVTIGGIFILLFPPVWQTISNGQVNIIVIVLICTFWCSLKEKKSPFTASLPLAVSILTKIYPGIFLLYLFIKKDYKKILLTVGIIALFSFTALLLFPTEIWADWYSALGSTPYGGVFSERLPSWKVGNQSLNGFITRFFRGVRNLDIDSLSDFIQPLSGENKTIVSGVVGYLSSGFILLIWMFMALRKRRDPGNKTWLDLDISMLLITMYLVAPISWDHHLVFILPSIIVLLNYFISNYSLGGSFWSLIILSALLFVNVDYGHPIFQEGIIGIFVSVHFFSVLGIWFINFLTIHNSSRYKKPGSV